MTKSLLSVVLASVVTAVNGQNIGAVYDLAESTEDSFLETVKQLVEIESGSQDIQGLSEVAALIADRLQELGGDVDVLQPELADSGAEDSSQEIGSMVRARFRGIGSANVLLLAHMDTVYQRGDGETQPFRLDDGRAYGLGIADDKQGIATILHTVEILDAISFRDYGTLTVLVNADEEIGSPGSKAEIERLGREHDVVLSFERAPWEVVALATSGAGQITLRVTGRASHAGNAPDQGRNALYELAHQVLRMRDLSRPDIGLNVNWTLARAGSVSNAIPAYAEASADVRVARMSDWDDIVDDVRALTADSLIPDTQVEVIARFSRPPLEVNEASRLLAAHLAEIYAEIGRSLEILSDPVGGGTDAAYAGMSSEAAVVEGMGAVGFGAHSLDAEYILIESIAPTLYLAARAIMDVSTGVVPVITD